MTTPGGAGGVAGGGELDVSKPPPRMEPAFRPSLPLPVPEPPDGTGLTTVTGVVLASLPAGVGVAPAEGSVVCAGGGLPMVVTTPLPAVPPLFAAACASRSATSAAQNEET